jgi:hypothetical protein
MVIQRPLSVPMDVEQTELGWCSLIHSLQCAHDYPESGRVQTIRFAKTGLPKPCVEVAQRKRVDSVKEATGTTLPSQPWGAVRADRSE